MESRRLIYVVLGVAAILLSVITGMWALQAAWLTAADPGASEAYQSRFWIRVGMTAILLAGAAWSFRTAWRKKYPQSQ